MLEVKLAAAGDADNFAGKNYLRLRGAGRGWPAGLGLVDWIQGSGIVR